MALQRVGMYDRDPPGKKRKLNENHHMEFVDVDKPEDTYAFARPCTGEIANGFQTAGGKGVKVSEAALERARRMFESMQEEVDDADCNHDPIENILKAEEEDQEYFADIQEADDTHLATGGSTEIFQTVSEKAEKDFKAFENDLENTRKISECMQDENPKYEDVSGAKERSNVTEKNKDIDIETSDMNKTVEIDMEESMHQEVLESTFALLADEEENEGNRNALFGDLDPIPLQHITQTGGKIPLLHVYALRVYPVTYMSRNEQGRNVYESEKSFRKHQRQREQSRQSRLETIFAEVQNEIQDNQKKKTSKITNLNKLLKKDVLEEMSTAEILEMIESLPDDSIVLNLLSSEKLLQLEEVKLREQEQVRLNIQSVFEKRIQELKDSPSVPLLKVRIMDVNDGLTASIPQNVILSIWRPENDLQKDLIEGATIQLQSLNPTPNSLELRLNSTRSTQFHPLPVSSQTLSQFTSLRRTYSSLFTILDKNFCPLFGEFDTVGIIVHIADMGLNAGHTVYVADADRNILGIRFWTSVANEGLETEVQLKNFVVLENLQWRTASSKCIIPCAFVQDTSMVSLETSVPALRQALYSLREDVKDLRRFVDFSEMKILEILGRKRSTKERSSSGRRIITLSPPL